MKKNILVLLVILVLVIAMSSVASAQDNANTPLGINSLTVSPNPATAGSNITVAINANMTSVDGTTLFCLYAPVAEGVTFPGTITLSYYSGFTPTNVVFSTDATTCPSFSGQTGQAYSGTGLPTTDTTYTGSTSFTVGAGTAPGTYTWTLLLQEPGGGVNPDSTQHEIIVPDSPDTGLSGTIIDTKTSAPWQYGAEILVTQMTGVGAGKKGSAVAASDGTWSITFGTTDTLSLCGAGCSAGNTPATYRIEVNYRCDLQTGNGIRPNFSTSTDLNCPLTVGGTALVGLPNSYELVVPDTNSGAIQDVGNIQTVTGPTAINLLDVGIASNQPIQFAGLTIMLLGLAVTGIIVWRRKTQA